MKSLIITLSILCAFSAQAEVENLKFEASYTVKKVFMDKGLSSNLLQNYQGLTKLLAKK